VALRVVNVKVSEISKISELIFFITNYYHIILINKFYYLYDKEMVCSIKLKKELDTEGTSFLRHCLDEIIYVILNIKGASEASLLQAKSSLAGQKRGQTKIKLESNLRKFPKNPYYAMVITTLQSFFPEITELPPNEQECLRKFGYTQNDVDGKKNISYHVIKVKIYYIILYYLITLFKIKLIYVFLIKAACDDNYKYPNLKQFEERFQKYKVNINPVVNKKSKTPVPKKTILRQSNVNVSKISTSELIFFITNYYHIIFINKFYYLYD